MDRLLGSLHDYEGHEKCELSGTRCYESALGYWYKSCIWCGQRVKLKVQEAVGAKA